MMHTGKLKKMLQIVREVDIVFKILKWEGF